MERNRKSVAFVLACVAAGVLACTVIPFILAATTSTVGANAVSSQVGTVQTIPMQASTLKCFTAKPGSDVSVEILPADNLRLALWMVNSSSQVLTNGGNVAAPVIFISSYAISIAAGAAGTRIYNGYNAMPLYAATGHAGTDINKGNLSNVTPPDPWAMPNGVVYTGAVYGIAQCGDCTQADLKAYVQGCYLRP